MSTYFTKTTTPVGELLLVANEGGHLTGLYFANEAHATNVGSDAVEDASREPFSKVIAQLAEYFAGARTSFDDIKQAPVGTPFQKDVWRALAKIPYGTTTTYAKIAADIGKPDAVRAVGAANGRNPISILVPCHRVIGKDGSLTGYAGGLANKKVLLALETNDNQQPPQPNHLRASRRELRAP
jgi:methylated-DNA-[protein]-cysteine S-methyltransferase